MATRDTFFLAMLTCAAASVSAQSGPQLITLTDVAPLVVTQDPTTCAQTRCVPAGMPAPATAWAGGVAYDPTTRGVWITDGISIARVDAANRCAYSCPPAGIPGLGVDAVTGLAFDPGTNRLWTIDAGGTLRAYDVANCTLSLASSCTIALPTGHLAGGLALDVTSGRLFASSSNFAGGTGGDVQVLPLASPCTPLCSFPVSACGGSALAPITGLAWSGCTDTLWATDGRATVAGTVDIVTCAFAETSCCRSAFGETFVGLGIAPGRAIASGTSCTGSGCSSCRSLMQSLSNDPVLGNAAFGLDLEGAPGNSVAFAAIQSGGCLAPGAGATLPSFCGELLVPLPAVVAGPVTTSGSSSRCDGTARLALPVPIAPALCGAPFASQFLGVCPQGPSIGTWVSNCLTWVVSG